MPKSAKMSQPQKEEAAVRAAFITRRGTIIAGTIAAVAAITVAVINWTNGKLPVAEKERLTVKVVDKINGKAIGGATVSLEASGVSAVNSTDSLGVIFFPIADPKKELRLRVEADGYEQKFNLRVTPADIVGAQEIGLAPIAKPSPTTTPTVSSPQSFAVPPSVVASSIVRGQVVDEFGASVSGAKVTVAGYVRAVGETDNNGNFQIPLQVGRGETIDLHIAKPGFRTRTQKHIVNKDSVTILLER